MEFDFKYYNWETNVGLKAAHFCNFAKFLCIFDKQFCFTYHKNKPFVICGKNRKFTENFDSKRNSNQ